MRIYILLFCLVSCKAPQIATEVVTKDSVIVREVPRIIELPGSVLESPSINLDSLVQLIQSGVKSERITETLIRTDPETNLRVGLLIDELGNLTALCEQQEHTIQFLEKQVEHWRYEYETRKIIQKPKLIDRIGIFLIVALLCIVGVKILTSIVK